MAMIYTSSISCAIYCYVPGVCRLHGSARHVDTRDCTLVSYRTNHEYIISAYHVINSWSVHVGGVYTDLAVCHGCNDIVPTCMLSRYRSTHGEPRVEFTTLLWSDILATVHNMITVLVCKHSKVSQCFLPCSKSCFFFILTNFYQI